MYNKAYESLVASKWIIFLFKSRNILCVWPLPNSVTMSQWLLSFSVCIFKISAFLNKLLWWLNEVTLKSKIPDTVIAQQSWVTIVIIICLNILVIIFATPLPRPALNTRETQKWTLTWLQAAFLLGISLYIFKSILNVSY